MAATEEIFDAENPTLGRQDDELVPAETPKADDGNMPEPSSPMGLMLLRPVDQRFNSGFAHEEARDIIEIAANRRTSVESNKSSRKMEGSDNTQSMRSLRTRKDPKAFWARLESGLMHFLSGSRIKPLVEAVEDQDRDEMMKRAQTVHTFILWALMVIAMVCAIVFFVIFDRFTTMIVIGVMSASCLFSLATLMISLRIKGADPTLAINMFIWSFIMTALLGPVACHIALGGGESGADILIFSLLAPVSCLFLVHWRPLLMTFVVTLVRQILVLIVIIAGSQLKDVFPVPPSKFPDWEEVGILIFVHIVVPLLITIAFRHAMGDFQMWHEDGLEQSDRYEQSRNDHQRLIECLIPKQMMEEHCVGEEGSPKESFPLETPDKWWDMKPVWHKNCSTIQMDIKGFTDLSSQISAEELVILVNAVFSMIDEAALCVGSAWKVETIGDCFKCMVGGIEPCQDHAQRATALAMAIIEIVKSIATRLDVNLTCRCGVNSGDVMGAMMGTLLPRYLMYGPTCDLMNVLESQGKPGHVQCSLETASRLGPEWIMTEHSVTLHNQEIHTHLLACNEENREAMFKGHGGEGLRVFLDNLAGKIPTGGGGGGLCLAL